MLVIERAGAFTTVQDLGRPGFAHLGVPLSGAADRGSLMLGNRLVGNPDDAAALECTLAGPLLIAHAPALVCLTGAPVAARIDGRRLDMHRPTLAAEGSRIDVGVARAGLRTYLCVAGGIDAPVTMGSRSTDTLSGLGPAPLAAGDRVAVGAAAASPSGVDVVPVSEPSSRVRVRLMLGPRADWLEPAALERLAAERFSVSPTSNRVGVRLSAVPLPRARTEELRSEGMIAGAVQVPPSGQPIVMLADHPTTGGYPVVGCIPWPDLDRVAQLRPGDELEFDLCSTR